MDAEKIEKYLKSFNKYRFEDFLIKKYENINIKNPYYYEFYIDKWYKQRFVELNKNDNLKDINSLLQEFLYDTKVLFLNIFELYKSIERYNDISVRINRISLRQFDVNNDILKIESYKILIDENLIKNNIEEGCKIREFIVKILEEIKHLLISDFAIDINNSPLKFNKTIKLFKKIKTPSVEIRNIKSEKEYEYYEYFEITTLFAQGFINELPKGKCRYKEIVFKNTLELDKYLKENVIKKIDGKKQINFRQYLRNTLTNSGSKDLYSNVNLMNKTYEYCIRKGINISDEFKQKWIELNN